jgi:hypothetical protein
MPLINIENFISIFFNINVKLLIYFYGIANVCPKETYLFFWLHIIDMKFSYARVRDQTSNYLLMGFKYLTTKINQLLVLRVLGKKLKKKIEDYCVEKYSF